MTIRVVVYGDKIDLADELQEEFVAVAKEAIGEAGDLLVGEVERLLQLRGGPDPSPEGQPPAFQTGELLASVSRLPPRVKGRVASSGVRVEGDGALRLEYGKTDARGIRTFPHPFVRPALTAMEGPIGDLLRWRLG